MAFTDRDRYGPLKEGIEQNPQILSPFSHFDIPQGLLELGRGRLSKSNSEVFCFFDRVTGTPNPATEFTSFPSASSKEEPYRSAKQPVTTSSSQGCGHCLVGKSYQHFLYGRLQ